MTTSAPTKPSALDALRALSKKAPAPETPALSTQITDPAIAGATRVKDTVKLGFDPQIAEHARHAASLKEAMDRATAEFAVEQAKMRDYGKNKRDLYNSTLKCDVTTVCVPYSVEVSGNGDGSTPGRETRYVQVICTSKYSVQQDTVLRLEPALGPDFKKLFTKEETKVLKPNAEELIRQILTEAGLTGEDLDNSMDTLFETVVKVTANKSFEHDIRTISNPEVRFAVEQAVTRQQPGLKFPV